MRYLVGFGLFLLALGTLRVVGCGEEPEPPECLIDEDCDDQNECTDDTCDTATGCFYAPSREGDVCGGGEQFCTYGRCEDGACISGTGRSYWEDYEGKTCRGSNCTNYRCREGECVCSGWCICGL